jgi:hypothetical protein
MTIEFKPGRFILGVWVGGNEAMDLLGAAYRDGADPRVTCRYRLRYHIDDLTFSSRDEKDWKEIRTAGPTITDDEAVSQLGNLFRALSEALQLGPVRFYAVFSDDFEKFTAATKDEPFFRMAILTKEEAEHLDKTGEYPANIEERGRTEVN